MIDIMKQQKRSTGLVLGQAGVKRIFVDGGFSKNSIFMNLLADAFPQLKIFAAAMSQTTALGSALAIHQSWNDKRIPDNIIELRCYTASNVGIETKS